VAEHLHNTIQATMEEISIHLHCGRLLIVFGIKGKGLLDLFYPDGIGQNMFWGESTRDMQIFVF
jgi:hypothetical protein